jgi:hypothetical protein
VTPAASRRAHTLVCVGDDVVCVLAWAPAPRSRSSRPGDRCQLRTTGTSTGPRERCESPPQHEYLIACLPDYWVHFAFAGSSNARRRHGACAVASVGLVCGRSSSSTVALGAVGDTDGRGGVTRHLNVRSLYCICCSEAGIESAGSVNNCHRSSTERLHCIVLLSSCPVDASSTTTTCRSGATADPPGRDQ